MLQPGSQYGSRGTANLDNTILAFPIPLNLLLIMGECLAGGYVAGGQTEIGCVKAVCCKICIVLFPLTLTLKIVSLTFQYTPFLVLIAGNLNPMAYHTFSLHPFCNVNLHMRNCLAKQVLI